MEKVKEAKTSITQDTLLPISLIISLISLTFFAATWYVKGDHSYNSVNQIQEYLKSIDKRLSRIEGKLGVEDGD